MIIKDFRGKGDFRVFNIIIYEFIYLLKVSIFIGLEFEVECFFFNIKYVFCLCIC